MLIVATSKQGREKVYTLAKMKPPLSEEEEEEGILEMEEWDNLRPKKSELLNVVEGSDGVWREVGIKWVGRVVREEGLVVIDEEQSGNMVLCFLFWGGR